MRSTGQVRETIHRDRLAARVEKPSSIIISLFGNTKTQGGNVVPAVLCDRVDVGKRYNLLEKFPQYKQDHFSSFPLGGVRARTVTFCNSRLVCGSWRSAVSEMGPGG